MQDFSIYDGVALTEWCFQAPIPASRPRQTFSHGDAAFGDILGLGVSTDGACPLCTPRRMITFWLYIDNIKKNNNGSFVYQILKISLN